MAPSHRVHGTRTTEDDTGRTQLWPREDEKAVAASTVVLFIRACLGLLSVAPVGVSSDSFKTIAPYPVGCLIGLSFGLGPLKFTPRCECRARLKCNSDGVEMKTKPHLLYHYFT